MVLAEHAEVFRLIEGRRLRGRGIGYVDAQLLAACRLTSDASLWTRDRRLASLARRLDPGYEQESTTRSLPTLTHAT